MNKKPERFWTKYFDFANIEKFLQDEILIARERIIKKSSARNALINEKQELRSFSDGDLVLLEGIPVSNTEKNQVACFFKLFEGPYIVKNQVSDATYILSHKDGKEREVFYVNKIRKYHGNQEV